MLKIRIIPIDLFQQTIREQIFILYFIRRYKNHKTTEDIILIICYIIKANTMSYIQIFYLLFY